MWFIIKTSDLHKLGSTCLTSHLKSVYASYVKVGESGVPLRLIERYACELEQDFFTIAVTFEAIREKALRKAGLPVVGIDQLNPVDQRPHMLHELISSFLEIPP